MKSNVKITLLSLCFLLSHTALFAQTEEQPVKREAAMEHIVGVQMNELIRQVFNFNNVNNSANNNPYLLIYTLTFKKCGIGIRAGLGYTYQDFTTEDGVTKRLTQINDLRTRLGVEKRFQLSPKWSTGVGVDGVFSMNDNHTESILRSFDTVTTKSTAQLTSFGGGAMAWLRYHISSKVLVGTEASFYYTTGNQDQRIEITQRDRVTPPFTGYRTAVATNNSKSSAGVFSVPVSFFLIVKF